MQALADLPTAAQRLVTEARRTVGNVRQCLRIGQLASAEMHLTTLELYLSDIEKAVGRETSHA